MKLTKKELLQIISNHINEAALLATSAVSPANQKRLGSGEWKEIEQLVNSTYSQFNKAKELIKNFYDELDYKNSNELAGKRQPKIMQKMHHFTGDITPSMLVSLLKDVKSYGFLLKD